MRFDLFKWHEVKPNETLPAPQGRLQVMCSKEANLFVTCDGYEVLAGFGQAIDVTISEEITFRVETDKAARVFIYRPASINMETTGEIFTNIDRLEEESGSLAMIRQEIRRFELLKSQEMQEMREQLKEAKALAKPEPVEVDEDPVEETKEDALEEPSLKQAAKKAEKLD